MIVLHVQPICDSPYESYVPSVCGSGVQLPAGDDAVHGRVHPEGVCGSRVGHSHCQCKKL